MNPDPDYKAAWQALSEPLSWMHENPRLKVYWGWNLADIANDLIDKAYPVLRSGGPAALSPQTLPAPGQVERLEKHFVSELAIALSDAYRREGGIAPIARRHSGAATIRNIAILEAAKVFTRCLATVAAVNDEGVARIAVDQNDAMRQELAHVGNLISDLERAMRVDPARADGTWPDLAGRIQNLTDAAIRLLSQGGGKA